jgi:hypothetical protein
MPIHDWEGLNARVFHAFHHDWISQISRALNDELTDEYYALAEQITGPFGPDVVTLQRPSPARTSSGGMAVAERPPRTKMKLLSEAERYSRKRKRVVVKHSSDHTVVAVVEIVSPGNKASQGAFDQFVSKSRDLIDGGIHLAILDPFPPGPRDPEGVHAAIWDAYSGAEFRLPKETPLTFAGYLAGPDPEAYVSPVAVGETLPELPVFLNPDFYVPLDCERTYSEAWSAVPKYWRNVIENKAAQ